MKKKLEGAGTEHMPKIYLFSGFLYKFNKTIFLQINVIYFKKIFNFHHFDYCNF
jgi:hypothetical protein